MKQFLNNLTFVIFLLSSVSDLVLSQPINLTPYKFPVINNSDKLIRIAILASNDLHGGIFPNYYPDSTNKKFLNGGGTYLYSYAKILKEDWGNQFLWLDGGDQFQGTMECMLSEGYVMKDYYNFVGLNAMAIGNHEFDYGINRLREFYKQEKFPILAANIKDNKANKYIYEKGMWDNVKAYQIFTINTKPQIKIGVIGLATQLTISMSAEDLSGLTFTDYFEETKKWNNYLRNTEKVDAVLLLVHFGPQCNGDEEKMKLQMRDSSTSQKECEQNEEIMSFLEQVKEAGIQIDGVIAAHVHDVAHHWISDIPVVESSGPDYFNVLYLAFKNNTNSVTIQPKKTQIEGPVPICEKLWPDSLNCEYKYEDSSTMKNFVFHNKDVTLDQDLSNLLKDWKDIIDTKINNNLVETLVDMTLDDTKETVLTNFINDVGRIVTDSDICFYNLGGIRTNWYRGYINEIDVFKMFPFNNTWVRFEMTGEEIEHMFLSLEGYLSYPQSGTLQTFKYLNPKYKLMSIIGWDGFEEKPLDPKKTYKICTNDFLAEGGSGMGEVRKWYKQLRNPKVFGNVRDLIYDYLKLMKVIKKEYYMDDKHKKITILD